MRGKSFRTSEGHEIVWNTYNEILNVQRTLPGKLSNPTNSAIWKEIEDKTSYSTESIRKIIAKKLKQHSPDYKGTCKFLIKS